MSLSELKVVINGYKRLEEQQEKKEINEIYLLASLTAGFVNKMLSGKKIPTLYELFPNVFQESEMDWKVYEQQFLDFSQQFNKQRGSNT